MNSDIVKYKQLHTTAGHGSKRSGHVQK